MRPLSSLCSVSRSAPLGNRDLDLKLWERFLDRRITAHEAVVELAAKMRIMVSLGRLTHPAKWRAPPFKRLLAQKDLARCAFLFGGRSAPLKLLAQSSEAKALVIRRDKHGAHRAGLSLVICSEGHCNKVAYPESTESVNRFVNGAIHRLGGDRPVLAFAGAHGALLVTLRLSGASLQRKRVATAKGRTVDLDLPPAAFGSRSTGAAGCSTRATRSLGSVSPWDEHLSLKSEIKVWK